MTADMIAFTGIPGIEFSGLLLAFMGFAVGVVSAFLGVGGGYMLTPALIVLGFPAGFAVGTGVTYIVAKSVIATFRHHRLGNVDLKLGFFSVLGTLVGVELGVNLLNRARDAGLAEGAVLLLSILLLTSVSLYTLWESSKAKSIIEAMLKRGEKPPRDLRLSTLPEKLQKINIAPMVHFATSRLTISIWIILIMELVVGALSGFLGVGGGFLRVPALTYAIGVPSIIAVGTDIFEIIISGSYNLVRQTMSGNVLVFAAVIMVLGASIGAQIGAIGTRYVRGVSVRYILSYSVFLSAFGSALKLAYILTGNRLEWLQVSALWVTLGTMAVLMFLVMGLVGLSLLRRRGKNIPAWAEPLVCTED